MENNTKIAIGLGVAALVGRAPPELACVAVFSKAKGALCGAPYQP